MQPTKIRVLIIDDSPDFVSLLKLYLGKEQGRYEIIDYDFLKNGRPGEDFDWSSYDILLLDYKLGESVDGLEWLQHFGKRVDFPPTIILTAEGDEYIAARAIKLGAADYINKKDVSSKRLVSLIRQAMDIDAESTAENKAILDKDEELVDKLRKQQHFESRDTRGDYKLVRLNWAWCHVTCVSRRARSRQPVIGTESHRYHSYGTAPIAALHPGS